MIFEQAIVNMREGMKAGLVQPRVLMDKVLPQLDANIADDVEKSIFWGPVTQNARRISARRIASDSRRHSAISSVRSSRRRTASCAPSSPTNTCRRCRDTFGRGALPKGAAWYAHNVRDNTMRSLTPAQVHQIGLDEVARIQDGMRAVAKDLGYTKPTKTLPELKAFFEWVKARDDMYFKSREELLAAYQAFGANVAPVLPKYFNLRPKADYEVRLVEPFREASASSGQYQGPSLDGKRPGIFYVNSYDLKARPRWALASLSLHEAAPGHHFQISLQRELGDLPMFRRFSRDTAYIEGWGLYAEYLGYEMGIYKDPAQRFGALDAELWRAIRLVTDTGIHFKGWTRQQTLDYMLANSPAEQTRAVSEAERFVGHPGAGAGVQDRPAQDRRTAQAGREGAGTEVQRRGIPRRGAQGRRGSAGSAGSQDRPMDRREALRLDCAGHDCPHAAERDPVAAAGRRVHSFHHCRRPDFLFRGLR